MRLILINTTTGYIDGDTADFLAGTDWEHTPESAVRRLVDHIGSTEASQGAEYAVYRADINGSEAVPVVMDGQDRETIEAVEESCENLGVFSL